VICRRDHRRGATAAVGRMSRASIAGK